MNGKLEAQGASVVVGWAGRWAAGFVNRGEVGAKAGLTGGTRHVGVHDPNSA